MIGRLLFGALAVLDAILLLSLLGSYGWFNLAVSTPTESIASLVIVPLLWAITLGERAIALGFVAAVATGIWKDLTGRERTRWVAIVSTPVLILTLCAAGFAWIAVANAVILKPPGFVHDRLTVFDALSTQASLGDVETLGVVSWAQASIGRFLIILLGVLYLAEKYLVQSWRLRWPVPIAPLLAAGWIAYVIVGGERQMLAYVNAQQWRVIGPQLSWLDAVTECESLGDGWRLPQREELARYLATYPAEIQGWTGAAWTSTNADGGGWAVAVDLKPRYSGRWNKGSEPTRDESLCELRTQPAYPNDWFTARRPELCARTTASPYLFTPGLSLTVLQNGNIGVTQPKQGAVCVRGEPTRFPVRDRRGYRNEQDYTRAAGFREAMAKKCGLEPESDWAACFVFAPDLPPFEESGDERMMRAFCEIARDGEGCHRYALLMDQHPEAADRAARYRVLACKRGYREACPATPVTSFSSGRHE